MEFDTLIDLVKTVTKNKLKNIDILGNTGNDGPMITALYEGILDGKITSDQTAVRKLYEHINIKDKSYQRVKTRLIRQLYNTTFFIDVSQPMFSERSKAFYNCYRDFACAYILITRDAAKAAIDLLEAVFEKAVKYEFIELCAEVTRFLRLQYGRGGADQDKHERYAQFHRKYEEKRRLEMLAFDRYENLINYYIYKRSPSEEVHTMAAQYFEELLPLAKEADTSQFYFHLYQIGVIKCVSTDDNEGGLLIVGQGLKILESRKNSNKGALLSLAINKLTFLLQLRRFEGNEGDEIVEYCLKQVDEGEFNWFRVYEMFFHYCLYAKRYKNALETYEKVVGHPRFKNMNTVMKDNWNLYGGYLQLLKALKQLDPESVDSVVEPYKPTKFINNFEVFTKDKEGMNIPLVLLPFLIELANKTFDASDSTLENLDKYRIRNIDHAMNVRSNIFLELLIVYAQKDFKPQLYHKKLEPSLNALRSREKTTPLQLFSAEIIPYEDLWDLLNAKEPEK